MEISLYINKIDNNTHNVHCVIHRKKAKNIFYFQSYTPVTPTFISHIPPPTRRGTD